MDKLKIKRLMNTLGAKYNLSPEAIKQIVNSPYELMYEKLRVLDLDKVESEDEVNALKTNFNLKAFGKLYISYPAVVARKNRKINASKINKKWKT